MSDRRRQDGQREPHRLIAGLAERRERHLERHWIVRTLVVLTGATVVLAGLAMLVAPGPAFVVIPIGLAMLALEFAWAERMLESVIDRAEAAGQAAKESSRAQRVVLVLGTLLAIGAFVAWAIAGDVPVLPV